MRQIINSSQVASSIGSQASLILQIINSAQVESSIKVSTYSDNPVGRHHALTHLPRFRILTDTFTAYTGDFLSYVYKLLSPYLYWGSISRWSGLYNVLLAHSLSQKK